MPLLHLMVQSNILFVQTIGYKRNSDHFHSLNWCYCCRFVFFFFFLLVRRRAKGNIEHSILLTKYFFSSSFHVWIQFAFTFIKFNKNHFINKFEMHAQCTYIEKKICWYYLLLIFSVCPKMIIQSTKRQKKIFVETRMRESFVCKESEEWIIFIQWKLFPLGFSFCSFATHTLHPNCCI